MDTTILVSIVAAALLLIIGILLFNTMVGRKNRVQFAFAGLMPN